MRVLRCCQKTIRVMIALKHIVYVWKGRCFCGEWGGFIDGLLLQADPKVISTNLETPSLKFQGWVILSTKQRDIYPFLKLLVPNCTWKWMVARRSFPFWDGANWQVRTVSFNESIVIWRLHRFDAKIHPIHTLVLVPSFLQWKMDLSNMSFLCIDLTPFHSHH